MIKKLDLWDRVRFNGNMYGLEIFFQMIWYQNKKIFVMLLQLFIPKSSSGLHYKYINLNQQSGYSVYNTQKDKYLSLTTVFRGLQSSIKSSACKVLFERAIHSNKQHAVIYLKTKNWLYQIWTCSSKNSR